MTLIALRHGTVIGRPGRHALTFGRWTPHADIFDIAAVTWLVTLDGLHAEHEDTHVVVVPELVQAFGIAEPVSAGCYTR